MRRANKEQQPTPSSSSSSANPVDYSPHQGPLEPSPKGSGPSLQHRPVLSSGRRPSLEQLPSPSGRAETGSTNEKDGNKRAPSVKETRPVTATKRRSRRYDTSALSPSLEASFAGPKTGRVTTSSTESASSTNTARNTGMAGATPSAAPTPSYPFPRMPSLPYHQPFTALSPTSPKETGDKHDFSPGVSATHNPSSSAIHGATDDPFPNPSLYDIVLQLNCENNLDSWWDALTEIARDFYKIERMSLALPVDPTDIENVPWGLKAAFDVAGVRNIISSYPKTEHSSSSQSKSTSSRRSEAAEDFSYTTRPPLESRHSYAGYEATRAVQADSSQASRPLPFRTFTSQDLRQLRGEPIGARTTPQPLKLDFERSDDGDQGYSVQSEPYAVVFRTLRILGREDDPILDSAAVNRILERGKPITLTRDYSKTAAAAKISSSEASENTPRADESDLATESTAMSLEGVHRRIKAQPFENTTSLPEERGPAANIKNYAYDDYEQFPTSPWSQSPAPSPAIQQDPDVNPFFASSGVDAGSFSPESETSTPLNSRDIHAIGVDHATTIIHLPIYQPAKTRDRRQKMPADQDASKTAPIAIVSLMSRHVPYPPNLIASLNNLGPHLATSFKTTFQATAMKHRISQALRRQKISSKSINWALVESGNLDVGIDAILLGGDNEDSRSSTIGSIASPSDYSISGTSQAGSVTATPELEQRPDFRADTSEYFDSKKRASASGTKSGDVPTSNQAAGHPTGHLSHRRLEKPATSDASKHGMSKKESKKLRIKKDGAGPVKPALDQKEQKLHDAPPRHTLLHSLGADFSASFQSMPVTAEPSSQDEGTIPPSEKLMRIVIDALPVQIFIAQPLSGEVSWVNSKFLSYRGQSQSEVKKDAWSTVHPDDLDECLEEWAMSLHTGQQFQHKIRIRRFDDVFRYFYVRAAPLRDTSQKIVYWIGTMIDLHDQHLAELDAARQLETAASEAKWRGLANSSPQIVFAVTKRQGVIFCNNQWNKFSGQTEEKALGTGFIEHVHPDDLEKCQLPGFDDNGSIIGVPTSLPAEQRSRAGSGSQMLSDNSSDSTSTPTFAAAIQPGLQMPQRKLSALASTGILRVSRDEEGKPSYSTEVRLQAKSGQYRWHLVRLVLAEPLSTTSSTDDETWYGTCTDINDHKELEKTLKETMDSKSRFLSNMSHEIRTPLNGIHGMANLLIDSNLSPEQMDQVDVIRASTEGLRDLINDILDLSKAEAGMIKLSHGWLYIRSVIEEVNDLTSSLALDKGLELNYLIESDVPSILMGDKFRFRQVLLNVIGNAIKFTSEGEVFVRCSRASPVSDSNDESHITIKIDVIDTGPGFTDRQAERLFKRFSQIDGSTTRAHGGSGLGLVISMQLVELHGGTMNATSTPGEGSTFSFTMKFGLPSQYGSVPILNETASPFLGANSSVEPSPPSGTGVSKSEEFISPVTMSPSEGLKQNSPSALSSASSDPSIRTARTSQRSTRSSQSSIPDATSMSLHLGADSRFATSRVAKDQRQGSDTSIGMTPLMYSILVICPLKWTQEAIIAHIKSLLIQNVPHSVVAKNNIEEAQDMISGEDALTFTHILLNVSDVNAVMAICETVSRLPSPTSVVIIASSTQRRQILEENMGSGAGKLAKEGKIVFVSKPIKPPRLAVIFDPSKSRDLSIDKNKSSAQLVATTQKRLFDDMAQRFATKSIRVLLVEDNVVSQMVMQRLLQRIKVDVDTMADGVQATEAVFTKVPDFYSLILLDLIMPNKDGYQTCREIRAWENDYGYPHIPIVALSANVLDDVWKKCRDAGFNSYLTKPLDFKELSGVLTAYLDPDDPSKPLASMKNQKNRH